jgi:hypothetical protein
MSQDRNKTLALPCYSKVKELLQLDGDARRLSTRLIIRATQNIASIVPKPGGASSSLASASSTAGCR